MEELKMLDLSFVDDLYEDDLIAKGGESVNEVYSSSYYGTVTGDNLSEAERNQLLGLLAETQNLIEQLQLLPPLGMLII